MTRTPAECVEAALANLTMAVDAEQAMGNETWEPLLKRNCYSRASAFREAIALLRTECASFLSTPNEVSP